MNVGKIFSVKMPEYTQAVLNGSRLEWYNGERLVERYTAPKNFNILSEAKYIFSKIHSKDKYLFCDILHPYDLNPEAAARYAEISGQFKALTGFYGKSTYKIQEDGTFTVEKWMKGRCPDSSICVTRKGTIENGKKVFSKDYESVEFIPKGREIVTKYTDGGDTKTVTERKINKNKTLETTTVYKRSQATGNWEEVK